MGLTTLAIFCWDLPEVLAGIMTKWAWAPRWHTQPRPGVSRAADRSQRQGWHLSQRHPGEDGGCFLQGDMALARLCSEPEPALAPALLRAALHRSPRDGDSDGDGAWDTGHQRAAALTGTHAAPRWRKE